MADQSKENLRAQLQTDDPLSPGNAMSTLAKMWADWRLKQFPFNVPSPFIPGMRFDSEGRETPVFDLTPPPGVDDMPFGTGGLGGIVRAPGLRAALKQALRNEGVSTGSIRGTPETLLDSLDQLKRWWSKNLRNVGGPTLHEPVPLGSGAQTYAFDLMPKQGPTGREAEVLKAFRVQPGLNTTFEEVMRNPPKGALDPSQFAFTPDYRAGFYVQPRASQLMSQYVDNNADRLARWNTETPWGRYGDILENLNYQAMRRGMTLYDDFPPNIGIYNNEPRVIDLGSYMPAGFRRRIPSGFQYDPNAIKVE